MAEERIEITLDGKKLMVEPGRTILEVAEGQGIRIPTLCNDPRLAPYASCWVCLVKVERAKGFVPSCGTRVMPGMVITTSSTDVIAARKMAFELLLSNHYGDCKAPCTQNCPSNVDIQGYLALTANGRFTEAVELIRRDNPMPAVIGRICPRPCESECRRQLVDEPLNVNGVKRFVADMEANSGGPASRPEPSRIGKRVAVIGAGPAGLSAAWYLTEKGVDVTIYEAMEKAGGMLRYGIPDYRLPQQVLDRSIAEMLSLGAGLRCGVTLGKDVTVEGLAREFDAVVLAIGAWKSRALRVPGEDHAEVLSGIEFLRSVNRGEPVKVGARVAVIGGGNTAMDAARCSLRLGAKQVTMYYRRTREEMPAADAEIEEALEEGIDIQYLAAPVSIESEGEKLKTLTLLKMELGEPDSSGRRRPVPVKGSEFRVPVDTVISAVGQYPDTSMLESIPGLVDERENLKGDAATGGTAAAGIFAAGDLLTGADIAIRAIAGGKHAARSVLAFLEGKDAKKTAEFLSKKEDFRRPTEDDFKDTPRAARIKPRVVEPKSRKKGFMEIESAMSAEQARKEAARCMECGCRDVGECRLKEYASDYGAAAKRFVGEVASHPIDESHPFISRDPSKCVLCGRCVRICLEVQGIGVLGYMYRGFSSLIAPSFGVPFGQDSTCISCGQCVSACPVGALTEKIPARKSAPLEERVEEGYCSLCSVGCALEYRYHGSLLTRTTDRFEAPSYGKLCKKGRFGHDFLNDPILESPEDADGKAVSWEKARETAARLLSNAKQPVMRISPRLSGEAIDVFIQAADKKGIPVEGWELGDMDPRWAGFSRAKTAAGSIFSPSDCQARQKTAIFIGDVASSNNVAFTEGFRALREGLISGLWIVGQDDDVSRRVASRLIPSLAGLKDALNEALDAGDVEILVNPEEALKTGSNGSLLESLITAAADPRVRVTTLWNSRNAGYLLEKLAAKPRKGRPARLKMPDLLLDIGVEDDKASNARRIIWGKRTGNDAACIIPLPKELLIGGRSHPSGRESLRIGSVDEEGLKSLTLIL